MASKQQGPRPSEEQIGHTEPLRPGTRGMAPEPPESTTYLAADQQSFRGQPADAFRLLSKQPRPVPRGGPGGSLKNGRFPRPNSADQQLGSPLFPRDSATLHGNGALGSPLPSLHSPRLQSPRNLPLFQPSPRRSALGGLGSPTNQFFSSLDSFLQSPGAGAAVGAFFSPTAADLLGLGGLDTPSSSKGLEGLLAGDMFTPHGRGQPTAMLTQELLQMLEAGTKALPPLPPTVPNELADVAPQIALGITSLDTAGLAGPAPCANAQETQPSMLPRGQPHGLTTVDTVYSDQHPGTSGLPHQLGAVAGPSAPSGDLPYMGMDEDPYRDQPDSSRMDELVRSVLSPKIGWGLSSALHSAGIPGLSSPLASDFMSTDGVQLSISEMLLPRSEDDGLAQTVAPIGANDAGGPGAQRRRGRYLDFASAPQNAALIASGAVPGLAGTRQAPNNHLLALDILQPSALPGFGLPSAPEPPATGSQQLLQQPSGEMPTPQACLPGVPVITNINTSRRSSSSEAAAAPLAIGAMPRPALVIPGPPAAGGGRSSRASSLGRSNLGPKIKQEDDGVYASQPGIDTAQAGGSTANTEPDVPVLTGRAQAAAGGTVPEATPSTLQRPQRPKIVPAKVRSASTLASKPPTGIKQEATFPPMPPQQTARFLQPAQPQHLARADSEPAKAPARSRSRSSGDGAPKTCHCKKSQCLKLYCECFSGGQFCTGCSCQSCMNRPEHADVVAERRDTITMRDPEAFVRKIQSTSNGGPEKGRHKRGCNCRRSHCLKKYCECYQGGVKCTQHCKCLDCQNLDDGAPRPEDEANGKLRVLAAAASTSDDDGTESEMALGSVVTEGPSTDQANSKGRVTTQGKPTPPVVGAMAAMGLVSPCNGPNATAFRGTPQTVLLKPSAMQSLPPNGRARCPLPHQTPKPRNARKGTASQASGGSQPGAATEDTLSRRLSTAASGSPKRGSSASATGTQLARSSSLGASIAQGEARGAANDNMPPPPAPANNMPRQKQEARNAAEPTPGPAAASACAPTFGDAASPMLLCAENVDLLGPAGTLSDDPDEELDHMDGNSQPTGMMLQRQAYPDAVAGQGLGVASQPYVANIPPALQSLARISSQIKQYNGPAGHDGMGPPSAAHPSLSSRYSYPPGSHQHLPAPSTMTPASACPDVASASHTLQPPHSAASQVSMRRGAATATAPSMSAGVHTLVSPVRTSRTAAAGKRVTPTKRKAFELMQEHKPQQEYVENMVAASPTKREWLASQAPLQPRQPAGGLGIHPPPQPATTLEYAPYPPAAVCGPGAGEMSADDMKKAAREYITRRLADASSNPPGLGPQAGGVPRSTLDNPMPPPLPSNSGPGQPGASTLFGSPPGVGSMRVLNVYSTPAGQRVSQMTKLGSGSTTLISPQDKRPKVA